MLYAILIFVLHVMTTSLLLLPFTKLQSVLQVVLQCECLCCENI